MKKHSAVKQAPLTTSSEESVTITCGDKQYEKLERAHARLIAIEQIVKAVLATQDLDGQTEDVKAAMEMLEFVSEGITRADGYVEDVICHIMTGGKEE
jgi:hypothetical protein